MLSEFRRAPKVHICWASDIYHIGCHLRGLVRLWCVNRLRQSGFLISSSQDSPHEARVCVIGQVLTRWLTYVPAAIQGTNHNYMLGVYLCIDMYICICTYVSMHCIWVYVAIHVLYVYRLDICGGQVTARTNLLPCFLQAAGPLLFTIPRSWAFIVTAYMTSSWTTVVHNSQKLGISCHRLYDKQLDHCCSQFPEAGHLLSLPIWQASGSLLFTIPRSWAFIVTAYTARRLEGYLWGQLFLKGEEAQPRMSVRTCITQIVPVMLA